MGLSKDRVPLKSSDWYWLIIISILRHIHTSLLFKTSYVCIYIPQLTTCPIHSNTFQYIPIYSNIFQYIPIYSNIIIPMYSLCTFHPFFNSRPATSSIHSGTAGPIRRRTSFRRDFLDAFDLEIRNHRWSLQGKCHEMSMFSSYLISVNK